MWSAGLVGALIGVVLGGGVAYVYAQQQLGTVKTQLALSNAQRVEAQQQTTTAQKKASDAQKVAAAAVAASTGSAGKGSSSSTSTAAITKPVAPVTLKQFAFVKKIAKSGSKYTLTVDYAEYLTGTAAAKAAKAHGDESPPPNDYYIVNDNKVLRKLPVKVGATVTLNDKADGTSDPNGYTATMSQWAALMSGPQSDRFQAVGYWLTITDGVVVHVAQQWVP